MKNIDTLPFYIKLQKKIWAYYQTIWKEKWKEKIHDNWLNNFSDLDEDITQKERVNMLYLLSKFTYFGSEELRQLLFSLFRDLVKYPIVEKVRRANGDTTDMEVIVPGLVGEMNKTRFLGVGNPSESGVHMLYFFRQECNLHKDFFINTSEIFETMKITETLAGGKTSTKLEIDIKDKSITRYVFIDDFCGSGSQASGYLKNIVDGIRVKTTNVEISYLMLVGTVTGIEVVRKLGLFDRVEAVYTIDETFKAFSSTSRYFKTLPDAVIEKSFSKETAEKYGKALFNPPLGHGDCQLLIGFHHNTPDNSLPIFWSDHNGWQPIFKRYNKIF
jgi:hypothetical protein